MRRTRQRVPGGSAIGVSVGRGGGIARMERIRDFAVAHGLAVAGRVQEARAILAKYDTGVGVTIEIVPGERGGGEVK